MIKFKVCPRCNGDLYLNQDNFGKYVNCLQCGYMKDVEMPVLAKVETVKSRPPPRAGGRRRKRAY